MLLPKKRLQKRRKRLKVVLREQINTPVSQLVK